MHGASRFAAWFIAATCVIACAPPEYQPSNYSNNRNNSGKFGGSRPTPTPIQGRFTLEHGVYEAVELEVVRNTCEYKDDHLELLGQETIVIPGDTEVVMEIYDHLTLRRSGDRFFGGETITPPDPLFGCKIRSAYNYQGQVTENNVFQWFVRLHRSHDEREPYQCEELVSDSPLPCDYDIKVKFTKS